MHLDPITLENHIVRLEPLEERHREQLRGPANDPQTWQLTTIRGDGAFFDAWFDLMLAGQDKGDQISHAVWSKADERYVGHSSFLVISPKHERLEIGWTWYEAAMRGTRINPACKHLLLGRAFACGAQRVELKTHGLNKHSQNAMKKMGATYEGTLRSHTRTWRGDFRDTVWFSVLKDEWPAVSAGLEARL
ncbi:GNAT family protein [Maricaulis sp.]|uniref:GNAT family N-acetyltransferase n=1 Tax=Maricaulis sp. TaxID=1486257 RepID=UPI001B2B0B70|nr:GNAT family protein [Maricaulis sp.]MBO6796367.1 GNAT family N-acetyltransferase [Maricaulis sp.]